MVQKIFININICDKITIKLFIGVFKMKRRNILLSVIILLIIITIILILNSINAKPRNSGIKLNNNSNVIEDKNLENLSITRATLVIDKNKKSTFTADVSNTEESDNTIEYINIIFKDKNGNVITTLLGYVGLELKKGDVTKIYATTEMDLSKVTKVEYEIGNIE